MSGFVDPPGRVLSRDTAHVRHIEDAVRRRLGASAAADSVVALIHARPFGPDRHAINWAWPREPVRVYVHLSPAGWLVAELRGDLMPRFAGPGREANGRRTPARLRVPAARTIRGPVCDS